MQAGADVVYQGALCSLPWHGFSDFLLRVNGTTSKLGDYAYDVADTKLARNAKPKHIIQLCVYADLLSVAQGVEPWRLHVVLGDGRTASLRTSDVRHYYDVARGRFEASLGRHQRHRPRIRAVIAHSADGQKAAPPSGRRLIN
jgi:uncharacterized protein